MALALCSLDAAAQSVTVVMENGLSYKFGADYVQSMTFEQVSQGSDLKVNSLGTDVYSGGNATLTFDLSDGGKPTPTRATAWTFPATPIMKRRTPARPSLRVASQSRTNRRSTPST